ncbi:MAG: hypothetical protein WA902_20190 [Thermosynechococcaceae cyanobacterium]
MPILKKALLRMEKFKLRWGSVAGGDGSRLHSVHQACKSVMPMQNSPDRNLQVATLLRALVTANQELSQSVDHLVDTMGSLSQNLDWVDGRISILGECQARLAQPEAKLTQAIVEAGPDLMATLKLQRSQLNESSQSLNSRCLQEWFQYGDRATSD